MAGETRHRTEVELLDDDHVFDSLVFIPDSVQQRMAQIACSMAKPYLHDGELEQEFAVMESQIHGITH